MASSIKDTMSSFGTSIGEGLLDAFSSVTDFFAQKNLERAASSTDPDQYNITDALQIVADTRAKIEEYKTKQLELNEACINYSESYRTFYETTQYDASVLKQKMKDALQEVVPSDI